MDDPARVPRLLLDSASDLARAGNARAIMAYVDALPELEAVPDRMVLVARDEEDLKRIEILKGSSDSAVRVPRVTLNRLGQVSLAIIIALSQRIIDLGDTVVFLTGPYRSIIDTIVIMSVGSEYELFDSTDQPGIDEHIKRAVFHRALTIALNLGQFGREGKRVGALFVIGDTANVRAQSEQMILNPFKGYDESERNILDDVMTETVKEYASLDGAFIIRGNGVIEAAGARLKAGLSEGLPSGLGARHAAAAGITANTKAIALTVSGSDGNVRVWRAGKMVTSFETGVV